MITKEKKKTLGICFKLIGKDLTAYMQHIIFQMAYSINFKCTNGSRHFFLLTFQRLLQNWKNFKSTFKNNYHYHMYLKVISVIEQYIILICCMFISLLLISMVKK